MSWELTDDDLLFIADQAELNVGGRGSISIPEAGKPASYLQQLRIFLERYREAQRRLDELGTILQQIYVACELKRILEACRSQQTVQGFIACKASLRRLSGQCIVTLLVRNDTQFVLTDWTIIVSIVGLKSYYYFADADRGHNANCTRAFSLSVALPLLRPGTSTELTLLNLDDQVSLPLSLNCFLTRYFTLTNQHIVIPLMHRYVVNSCHSVEPQRCVTGSYSGVGKLTFEQRFTSFFTDFASSGTSNLVDVLERVKSRKVEFMFSISIGLVELLESDNDTDHELRFLKCLFPNVPQDALQSSAAFNTSNASSVEFFVGTHKLTVNLQREARIMVAKFLVVGPNADDVSRRLKADIIACVLVVLQQLTRCEEHVGLQLKNVCGLLERGHNDETELATTVAQLFCLLPIA